MARIAQRSLFSWEHVDARSDQSRLRLVLDHLPDEALMTALEKRRGRGRDQYPVRAMWNSLVAGIVYQHESIEQLRRELMRNAELRQTCGFDPFRGSEAVPTSSAYSRFTRVLFSVSGQFDEVFDALIESLREQLPDLGMHLGYDGKSVDSAGKPVGRGKDGSGKAAATDDGRRDVDADWGTHVYRGVDKAGKAWKKVKTWFGYKLHLLCDVVHELPLSYTVTKASASEYDQVLPLVEKLRRRHPETAATARTLTADRGVDSTEIVADLYDDHDITPVIDIRNCWKTGGDEVEGGGSRQVFPDRCARIMYDYRGTVTCLCPKTGREHAMAFGGYEKTRRTLKYVCPVKHYGAECAGAEQCEHHAKHVRIPLSRDRRVFTPVARSSFKWRRLYRSRSAMERVFSRLDVSFGWERHYIRGMKKMQVRMGMSFIVMLALALGHLKNGEPEKMRSLVKSPALALTG